MDHVNRIGQRVNFRGQNGTIKYSGPLKHTKDPKLKPNDVWVGIEWDDPKRGKHKGTVQKIQYFKCDKGKTGSLLRLETLSKKIDILEAYVKRYFKDFKIYSLLQDSREQFIEELNKANLREEIEKTKDVQIDNSIFVKTSLAKKQIEFYGFQDIWSKLEDLSKVRSFSVDKLQVGNFEKENLGEIFKNLKELSLEDNLIYSWEQVNILSQWFEKLEFLNLNYNQIYTQDQIQQMQSQFAKNFCSDVSIPMKSLQFQTFQNLKTVSLSHTNMTCKSFNQIKQLFQNVEELVLSNNDFKDFQNLQIEEDDFKNLKKLDLSHNKIQNLQDMSCWKIDKLQYLNLHSNQLQDFDYLDIFKNLEHLNISKNELKTLNILHSLAKLEKLTTLKASKNLLIQSQDSYYIKSMFVSCIPKLKVLNGSELQKRERRDLEIFYLKNAFHEFFQTFKTNEFEYDLESLNNWITQRFPRIQKFIKIMGSPYPYEERNLRNRSGDMQNFSKQDLQNVKQQSQKVGKNFCIVQFLQQIDNKKQEILCQKFPLTIDFLFLKAYLTRVLKFDMKKQKIYILRDTYRLLVDHELDNIPRYSIDEVLKLLIVSK